MAVCGYMLGEHLPDIQIILQVGCVPSLHTTRLRTHHEWLQDLYLLECLSNSCLAVRLIWLLLMHCTHCMAMCIHATLQDEFGNRVKAQEGQCDSLKLKVTGTAEENDDPVQIQKLWADGQVGLSSAVSWMLSCVLAGSQLLLSSYSSSQWLCKHQLITK